MANQQNNQKKDEAPKKTVYKETQERINEKKPDSGETSSVADMGRTDLISRPERKHKPLGSSHEPGTIPGTDL
ncbi:hypothetical protein TH53_09830 [Pedobacter lusitanus]|uniref:Uncharacterized protein n=1 Tax=Pedobacter lusitanus TaxID=1503925 RepID=A0A0D0FXY7_9SPHI|nr:hypothetical protein [Pedobacter lusitanus]KIO77359.1 hypothetical protein TH53_09830 [Pedobacter lusitanus]